VRTGDRNASAPRPCFGVGTEAAENAFRQAAALAAIEAERQHVFRRAESMAERSPSLWRPDSAEALYNLGLVFAKQGHHEDARVMLNETLQNAEPSLAEEVERLIQELPA